MLWMSADDSFDQLKQAAANRWQVPLLMLSLILLGVAFVQVGPPEPVLSFQQSLDQIAALQRGDFYAEASEMAQGLLAKKELAEDQRGAVYRLLAETIYLAERKRRHHDPENARRIIRNHREALAMGLPATADAHEQMGEALCWIDMPEIAVEQFKMAVDQGSERAGQLRRRIIELGRQFGRVKPEVIGHELSLMLADERLGPDDLLWAVWQWVKLLVDQDKLDQVDDLLHDVEPRFRRAGLSLELQYLQARRSYLTGDFDQAERLLLDLRGRVQPHESLGIRAGWFLGRVHQADGRPQEALAIFRDVIQCQPSGEYYLAGRLGIAECLGALDHMAEAADAYGEVAGLAAHQPTGDVVDRDAVRASLMSLYSVLRQRGQLEPALRFLRLAAALAPPDDDAIQAQCLELLADLYVSVGEERQARLESTTRPATWSDGALGSLALSKGPVAPASAREAFQEAGEAYLRLSKLVTKDPARSAESAWLAAVQFDRAGMPDQMIAVLEDFIDAHPASPREPDVLFSLGQALQSQGRYAEAVERYAENLARFPRAPSAMRSMVPMARSLISLGRERYPDAEKALLTIVEQPTEKGRYSPEALEYREALFVLGDLYNLWGKSATAISRLEEFLERYPDDPRGPRIKFVLAGSYRKSGLAMLSGQARTTTAGSRDLAEAGIERLVSAERLYGEVIEAYGRQPFASLSVIEQLHLKLSTMYRADCVFDMRRYEEALPLYEETSRRFRRDPMALAAQVQILNCYQRLGRPEDGRAVLRRIKLLIEGIPPERFDETPGGRGLAYWRGFFDWVGKSGLF